MKPTTIPLIIICAFALAGLANYAAADTAKVAGNWEMVSEGPQGTMTQTLTIEQESSKIKGTIKGQRGDAPFEGTVDENKISFTVKRQTPNGEMTIEYSGTIDGDAIKGTAKTPRGERAWSAKRVK